MPDRRGSSSNSGTSRRGFLAGTTAALTVPVFGAANPARPARAASLPSGLFTLGVASGEPLPDGVVLWTRLAPDPVAPDGLGGMPNRPTAVQWQVAADERFTKPAATGVAWAVPRSAHSVHVEVPGLKPGREYYYRFRAGNEISPVGRTKTAPRIGSSPDRFAFAFASCQNRPDGFYTAHAHLAQEDLDLVAFLGDYIYEGDGQGTIGRGHLPATEIFSLADYRVRHAQYRGDPDLQAAHAAFPWAVVFDDHEVENNFAGDISEIDDEPDQDRTVFRQRRAWAFQAYYEHMPLRRSQRPNGPDVLIHRRVAFGDLVNLYFLDTRQYRSDQVDDAQRLDPTRTILGPQQRAWLFDQTARSEARWNVLAQQVFFSQRDFAAGAPLDVSNDAWDNYAFERDAVRDHLVSAGTRNPVVLTGDVHAGYVSDIKADFQNPSSATVGTELVGTSIATGGDGMDQAPADPVQLAENPHIKFINRRRGYVRNVITRDEWTADFRVVDFVRQPGAPIQNRARFVIEDDRPGAQPA